MKSLRPSPAMLVALGALFVALGGSAIAAVAAIPNNGQFIACYQTSENVLNRIVVFAEPDEECPGTYARVSWSQAGGQGPAGPPGPQGPAGPAGQAASSVDVPVVVTQRRIVLRKEEPAVARCPVGRAISGGQVMHDGKYEPTNSFPVVENNVPVGWAVRPTQKRRFTLVPSTLQSTRLWTGLPPHRHTYYEPAHLLSLAPIPIERAPAELTVYVVCIRDKFEVPKP